ncbi:hydroxymethylglutaryl-CoA reductase, degradative [Candidatus Bathyarchaeota archaeon]|nr:hydroxymethylglutaryl-CoA reductase, degradative [Candidatus Bathyarchaeota archaeon]
MSTEEKRARFLEQLSELDQEILTVTGGLDLEMADQMRENVIGITKIPLGLAENFIVNNKPVLVPIATEERSVVTQASTGAGLVNNFTATATGNIMIGQIQVLDVLDMEKAKQAVLAEKESLLVDANTLSRSRKAVDIRVRKLESIVGSMLIVQIYVDVRDSMGANLIDSMCELLAPTIAKITGGQVNMRILSNLATERLVRVSTTVPKERLDAAVVDNIIEADAFAWADPYRASTSNKGIMNGIIGLLLATCNDIRAVEAGAHSYAAITGTYRPLTKWSKNEDGDLYGVLEMPMSVGTVGGVVRSHKLSRIVLRLLEVETASELSMIAGSVGLASNLGALYIMVTEGIKSIQA